MYGYFDDRSNRLDGQNVKTRNVRVLLEQWLGLGQVDWFDTAGLRRNPLTLLILICKVWHCRQLVWLPAANNMKVHIRLLDTLSRLRGFSILYIVIGGWLVEECRQHPRYIPALRRMRGIYTETKQMRDDLQTEFDLHNTYWFPNFRFTALPTMPQKVTSTNTLRLVFMARINRKKGLDWIFDMAEQLQQMGLANRLHLDLYGLMYAPDEQWFSSQLALYPWMTYLGLLQEQDILSTLCQYDLMLLPTHYYTEGMPGSILDAYQAALPVIVTKWKHATEFVQDNQTGYIVDFQNGKQQMINIIQSLLSDSGPLQSMRLAAWESSKCYSPEIARQILTPHIAFTAK